MEQIRKTQIRRKERNGRWMKNRESEEGGGRVGELEEQQTNNNNNNTSTSVCLLKKSATGDKYSQEKP